MKTPEQLITKAIEAMHEAAGEISEASLWVTEAHLRQSDMIPHNDVYKNTTERLQKLRDRVIRAAKDFKKLPI